MWNLAGKILESRLLLGTAHYPSLAMMTAAIQISGAQIITLSIQRQTAFDETWRAQSAKSRSPR
jgi:thiazole synthase